MNATKEQLQNIAEIHGCSSLAVEGIEGVFIKSFWLDCRTHETGFDIVQVTTVRDLLLELGY